MVMNKNFSTDEEKSISELRKRMINSLPKVMAEDHFLLYRFLKARNFNMDQAEEMILNCIEWRKMHQIDSILTDFTPPEVCQKYMSMNFLGFSKTGCPIRYTALGNVDTKSLFRSVNSSVVLKSILQVIESDARLVKKMSEKSGKPNNQVIVIFNFDHLTLARATNRKTIETFLSGVNALQDNYPEILKTAYIINASVYFTMGFAAVKSVMSDSVLSKIQVFARDGYQEALLKAVDAEVLPAFLGGSRTDPDGNPYCKTFLKQGEMIPETYYVRKTHLSQQPGVQKVLVERHSRTSVEIHVSSPGVLEWEFQTKAHDISMGLSCGNELLIPIHRTETDIEQEYGKFRCEKRGTYSLIFDNTYSWMHSKEVFYRTKLIPDESCGKNKPKSIPLTPVNH